jgi:peptidoglycan/LPS O-acetylase OafA/YrhL
MRAIAVALVIGIHLCDYDHAVRVARFIPPSMYGVRIFFVLSGYLITWLLLGEEARRGSIRLSRFYGRRAFRILPAAFLFMLVTAILVALGVYVVYPREFIVSALFVRNIWGGPGLMTPYFTNHLGHYWTLSVEEQFYLAWPIIFLLTRGRRRIAAVCAMLIVPTLTMELQKRFFHWRWLDCITYFMWFDNILVGCLLALLRNDSAMVRMLRGSRFQHPAVPLGAAAVALVWWKVPFAYSLMAIGTSILFALIINYLVEDHRRLGDRFLNFPWMAYIGRLSYSLYLWQQLFCYGDAGEARTLYRQTPVNLVLTLACAMASYHLVEQPMLNLRRRLFDAPRPKALATAV